jgi:selenophosphate synthetase-related protein
MTWFGLIIQIKLIYFNSLVNKFVVRFIIQVVVSKQIGVEVVGSIPTNSNIFFQTKDERLIVFFFQIKKRCTATPAGLPKPFTLS